MPNDIFILGPGHRNLMDGKTTDYRVSYSVSPVPDKQVTPRPSTSPHPRTPTVQGKSLLLITQKECQTRRAPGREHRGILRGQKRAYLPVLPPRSASRSQPGVTCI